MQGKGYALRKEDDVVKKNQKGNKEMYGEKDREGETAFVKASCSLH